MTSGRRFVDAGGNAVDLFPGSVALAGGSSCLSTLAFDSPTQIGEVHDRIASGGIQPIQR